MGTYNEILIKSALFQGMEGAELESLMHCLGGKVRAYESEEYIFVAGDEVNTIGILLEGRLEIRKESLGGSEYLLTMIEPSQLFAEGIVCTAHRISPVTVRVKENARVLFIPYERITKPCCNGCSFHSILIRNMMIILGEKNVILNQKIELLMLKGMRDKLANYLLRESANQKSMTFHIPLNRTQLADYLNVSRTSMCRELTRMKDEGLIDFYGQSFRILKKEELLGNETK